MNGEEITLYYLLWDFEENKFVRALQLKALVCVLKL